MQWRLGVVVAVVVEEEEEEVAVVAAAAAAVVVVEDVKSFCFFGQDLGHTFLSPISYCPLPPKKIGNSPNLM